MITDFTGTMIDSDSLSTVTTPDEQTHLYLHGFLTNGVTYTLKIASRLGQSPDTADNYTVDFDLHWEAISPPANDNFATPETLSTTVPNSTSGTTWDATAESSEPNLSGGVSDAGVWYEFTPSVSGVYVFPIDNEYPSDPINSPDFYYIGTQQLNSGSWGTIQLVIWDDPPLITDTTFSTDLRTSQTAFTHDPSPSDAVLQVSLTSGTRTHQGALGAARHTGPEQGSRQLRAAVGFCPPPANDNFANATFISGPLGSEGPIDMQGATPEVNEPVAHYWLTPPSNTAWWEWVAPTDGRLLFSYPGTDGAIAIYTGGALASLTPIVRSDDSGGEDATEGSSVGFQADAGVTYMIQVQDSSGDGSLEWEQLPPALGDTRSNAIMIPASGTVTGNNFGYTGFPPSDADNRLLAENPSFADFTVGNPVWYGITTDVPKILSLSTAYQDGSYAILVYKDVSGTLTPVTDEDGDDAAYLIEYDEIEPDDAKRIALTTSSIGVYYIVVVGFTTSDYEGTSGRATEADITQVSYSFTLGEQQCFNAVDLDRPCRLIKVRGKLCHCCGGWTQGS